MMVLVLGWGMVSGLRGQEAAGPGGTETRDSVGAEWENAGEQATGEGTSEEASATGEAGGKKSPEKVLKQRQYKLFLVFTIMGLVVFFLVVVLITIVRIGRYWRRSLGLGKRSAPTKYVDAWSQYRLKEDQK